ncbi:MAG: SGNH/GDSL hydrolase family protein [Candidatus Binatia bacterium]
MNQHKFRQSIALFSVLGFLAVGSSAYASTLTQNLSWTINRANTTAKYRVTAYGDSIYSGYNTSLYNIALFAAPTVDADYLQTKWNADMESYRRCKAGALAKAVYNEKIVNERSYMQTSNTRVVTFEMCGNDGLQARTAFKKQTGTCDYSVLNTALNNCTTYQSAAMSYINSNAHVNTKVKAIGNLMYPGYNADNVLSSCTVNGAKVNMRDTFLPYIAKMNWRACNFANTYGFKCVDNFSQYMGADYDSNADGQVDSYALRYIQGETEAAYVQRVTVTLRATLRDANTHFVSSGTSYDYIQSDDTHPTYAGGNVSTGIWPGGTASGSSTPDYTDSQYVSGKNPVWNRYGHERWGWGLSTFNPTAP